MAEIKGKKKLLIISHDKIGLSMAGPGIRYHYMAETLSKDFDVTVGFFDPSYLPEEQFADSYSVKSIPVHNFEAGFKDFDILIAHWLNEDMVAFCNSNDIFLIFDLYVPGPVENLASSIYSGKAVKPEDDFAYDRALSMYARFLENGDLFLFSNQRQLDYWLGYSFGAGQIHLSTYGKRPLYDRFIYAPMGIDTKTELRHAEDVIRNVLPGVSAGSKVLLWTGGIWGHFDAQILIRAMKRLEKQRPDIKLVFFGTQHPNPNVPEMKESLDARRLAQELKLVDKSVFFNDGWVKYSGRINYLLEADAAVSTHKASIETEVAHRTRVLDHILAGLPTISTAGDYFSDEVIGPKNLGMVVPPNNEQALEETILNVLEPKNHSLMKSNVAKVRADFDWSQTMQALTNFLETKPTKLPRLSSARPLTQHPKPMRYAKKVLPAPVKKALIRTFRTR